MKVVKKKYNKGGKLKKAVKKNQDDKLLTKKGGRQVTDADLAATGQDREVGVRQSEAKANTKAANENLAELKAKYKALGAEERKGEKGKALLAQMQEERDSKRGQSKYDNALATNKSGKVRVVRKTLKV